MLENYKNGCVFIEYKVCFFVYKKFIVVFWSFWGVFKRAIYNKTIQLLSTLKKPLHSLLFWEFLHTIHSPNNNNKELIINYYLEGV